MSYVLNWTLDAHIKIFLSENILPTRFLNNTDDLAILLSESMACYLH